MMVCLKHNGAEMKMTLFGAEMRSFSIDGHEYIWPGHPDVWKSSAPVLFPAIGGLKDGGATIAGVWYAVPRHGFVKFMDFEVAKQGEDYVTFTVHETEETKKVYPFDFQLSVTYRFIEGGFETIFKVENRSDRVMPFLLGGHPGFLCPMNEGETFEDYILHFEKEETIGTTLCKGPGATLTDVEPVDFGADKRTLKLDHKDFDRLDTYIFSGLNSRKVDLVHKDTGKGIRFSFDMDVLAIWSSPGKNAPYVCIEPWQGSPAYANETGRFEDKPYHVEIGPGQSYTCGYKMEVLG